MLPTVSQAFTRGIYYFTSWLTLVYTIGIYVLCAYSLFIIARNNQVRWAWIAFVPVLQFYIIGQLTEEYHFYGYRIPKLQWIVPALFFLQSVLGAFGGFLLLIPKLAVNAALALVLHKFFYLYEPRRAFMYAVLCLLFGRLPLVILLFILRNKSMIMSAAAYPYPFNRR